MRIHSNGYVGIGTASPTATLTVGALSSGQTGNVVIKIGQTVVLSGNQINLATNPVSVISWNPIPPGVNQVWVPIDPDNP